MMKPSWGTWEMLFIELRQGWPDWDELNWWHRFTFGVVLVAGIALRIATDGLLGVGTYYAQPRLSGSVRCIEMSKGGYSHNA